MNICILINSFNLGGAEKLMYDVAKELKNKKENVFIIAMKKAETQLEVRIKNEIENFGITADSVNKPIGRGKVSAVLQIVELLKKYKIEVLHTNGQSPDFYGRLASLIYKKAKVVVTIHSTNGYSRKIERILGFITGNYTAVSQEAKRYAMKSLGIKKIVTIENGIDFCRYELGEKLNDKKKTSILSVGRVVPEKGYHNIMKSMCEYLIADRCATWTILGETRQESVYFSELKNMIDKQVKDRIIFKGAVANPEDYYKKADFFILPSEYEGFGIAYIEAMAARLPVISNKVGVITDIANAGGFFVEILDKSIKECIDEAMSITEEQKKANIEFCKRKYSIEAITEKYREIYYSLKGKTNE